MRMRGHDVSPLMQLCHAFTGEPARSCVLNRQMTRACLDNEMAEARMIPQAIPDARAPVDTQKATSARSRGLSNNGTASGDSRLVEFLTDDEAAAYGRYTAAGGSGARVF